MKQTDKELRELDAWIAERVMGWKEIRPWSVNPDAGQFVIRHGVPVAPSPVFKFSPTTNPAAAMMVLEKLLERNIIVIQTDIHKPKTFLIRHTTKHWEQPIVEAETLPLAICLFAQKLFAN